MAASPGQSRKILSESSIKESYADFRELCLNFRSAKYEPAAESQERNDNQKASTGEKKSKHKFKVFSRRIKDFFVKKQEVTDINQKKLLLFCVGMLALEFIFIGFVVFIFYIVPTIREFFKTIHWVALLITAIALGVVMANEYFMQKLHHVWPKLTFKIPEIALQIFVFAYCCCNYNFVFLSFWYMLSLGLLIKWIWFLVTKNISYWVLLINIFLILVDFFFFYTSLSIWWFAMPVLGVTILYEIISSYEIKMLSEVGDYLTLLSSEMTRLTLSRID